MSSAAATLIGFSAIILWSLLAALTAAAGPIPAFQMNAMCFAIGALAPAILWLRQPRRARALRQPLYVWAHGIAGLFGYHALYFAALRLAPPAEASLVNYLWPLLIVLFSSLLPGERLRAFHVAGALVGFAGVVTISLNADLSARPEHALGYALAFAAALFWSAYSVLSRRMASVPTDAVVGFCAATAVLSLVCHLLFEQTVWPASPAAWAAIVALGLGPVGAAFYAWDIGCKRGDIRLLGVSAYAAPVLSTLALVAAGFAQATLGLWLACGLIVAGAVIASWDKLFGERG
ncbi:MAG: EamA family transporter [Beijerinckiaceae bacterium]|nr:EamA family transporter [Beijerinckiaceae bacterium]